MAIRTSGFQVTERPGIQYLNPGLLTPQLTNILPAASQGAGFVSQLAQISDEAKLAPLRQQLQEIAVQRQQAEIENLPLQRQLQQIQLARQSQPMERVLGTELKRIPRINSPEDTPAQDANGNYTFEEGDTNYDLAPIQRIEVTDPRTMASSIEERQLTPIATAETLSDRADNQEIKRIREESLAESRAINRQLAIDRLNNPEWTRVGFGLNPATGTQSYVIVNKKTGERQVIPSDLVPIPTGQDAMMSKMDAILGGGAKAAPNARGPMFNLPGLGGAPAAAVVAPSDTPAVIEDSETQSLIDDLTKEFSNAVVLPLVFNTVAEAEAAAAAGQIGAGSKIIVGGKTATWQ